MLIAELQDLHFMGGVHLPWIARSWSTAMDICIARGVDIAQVNGDVFEDPCHAIGRDSSAGDVHRAIIAPTQRDGAPDIYALPGNHDMMAGHAHALEIFKSVPGWTVVDEPQVLMIEDVRGEGGADVAIGFLPWSWNGVLMEDLATRNLPPDEFATIARGRHLQKLRVIADAWRGFSGMKILAGHAEITGAVNRYRQLPEGQFHVYDVLDLTRTGADKLSFGHYHKRQSIDGIEVYGGSLIQLNRGEEGNPTGFSILDTATGVREFIDVDCPRHYTLRLTSDGTYNRGDFREGEDRAVLVGAAMPMVKGRPVELPRGMVFEKEAAPADVRKRADGVTTESSVVDLLFAWMRSHGDNLQYEQDMMKTPMFRGIERPEIMEDLACLLEVTPIKPHSETTPGGLERLDMIRLWNVGPHEDTVLEFPAAGGNLIAYVGETGVGKSLLFEAPVAIWTGEFPQYDANFYDTAPPNVRSAGGEFRFHAGGQVWLARREVKISAGKSSRGTTTCDLSEVLPDGSIRHHAGPREKDFLREMRLLLGDPDRLLATVFQAQNDSGGIVAMEPAAAMMFMRRLVGADRFDAAYKTANDRAKAARQTLVKAQGAVERLGDVDAELTLLTSAKAEADAAETVLRDELPHVKAKVKGFADALQALHDRTREAKTWADSHAKIIDEGKKVRARGDVLKAEVAGLEATIAKKGQLETNLHRVREIETSIASAVAAAALPPDVNRAQRAIVESGIETLRAEIAGQAATAQREHDVRKGDVQRQFDRIDGILRTAKSAANARLEAIGVRRQAIEKQTAMLGDVGCIDTTKSPGGIISTCPLIEAAMDAREEDAGLAVQEADLRAALANGTWMTGGKAWPWSGLSSEMIPVLAGDSPIDAWKRIKAQLEAWPAYVEPASINDLRKRLASKTAELAGMSIAVATPAGPDLTPLREEARRLGSADSIARQLGEVEAAEKALPVKSHDEQEARAELLICTDAFRTSAAAEVKPPSDGDVRWAAQQLQDAERNVERHEEACRKSVAALAKASEKVDAARARVAERDALLADLEKYKNHVSIKEVIEEFLSPKGVPQLLIDLAIPQINDAIDGIMRTSIDGYRMRIDTQWVSPSGVVQEGLFVVIDGPKGERLYKAHSGGQKSLFRKVLRMGVGEYESQRHSAGHRVFCTDEPTIGLSEQYVRRFLDAICAMTNGKIDQCIIVEHSAAALGMVPTKYLLTQENGRVVVGAA